MLILDVDGVLTTGQFYYTAEGKVAKLFGADDHDALLLLKPFLEIRFISGDKKGFEISKKRISDDMKFPLDMVSTIARIHWIREHYDPNSVAYMGDGIFDSFVFGAVGYSLCPANAFPTARQNAHYVARADGGDRAVADACVHLLEKFFEPFDPHRPPKQFGGTGEWGI